MWTMWLKLLVISFLVMIIALVGFIILAFKKNTRWKYWLVTAIGAFILFLVSAQSFSPPDYLSYLNTYSDTQIPLSLPPVSSDMSRISIPEIGSIDIPNSMEIQNQADRQSVEAYRKAVGLSPSNYEGVIFRQKDKDKYSCILVNTHLGEPGDFSKLSEHFTLSEKELSVLSQQMRNTIQKQIEENPGMKMLEWYPPKVEIINDMTAVVFSYHRQLADRPPVLVWTYEFQNYDRSIALTISYRETEKQYWEPLFKRSLDSFRITNIIGNE
ncbi:MAG: hypothetical protein PHG06_22210 [Parabacteroides sp.]|nr:hypothetical protein [Eubacteriales bacterium]MDD4593108.1 hypothetical protein [Parabacteroides sp.]